MYVNVIWSVHFLRWLLLMNSTCPFSAVLSLNMNGCIVHKQKASTWLITISMTSFGWKKCYEWIIHSSLHFLYRLIEYKSLKYINHLGWQHCSLNFWENNRLELFDNSLNFYTLLLLLSTFWELRWDRLLTWNLILESVVVRLQWVYFLRKRFFCGWNKFFKQKLLNVSNFIRSNRKIDIFLFVFIVILQVVKFRTFFNVRHRAIRMKYQQINPVITVIIQLNRINKINWQCWIASFQRVHQRHNEQLLRLLISFIQKLQT